MIPEFSVSTLRIGQVLIEPTGGSISVNGIPLSSSAHSHPIADITTLQSVLDGKASLDGSYANPSWITSLSFSKLTTTPTTLQGYGITGNIPSSQVTGNFPSSQITGNFSSSRITGTFASTQIVGNFPSSQITGSFPASQVTGTFPSSQVTGNFPMSQVTGNLAGSRITGSINSSLLTGPISSSLLTVVPAASITGVIDSDNLPSATHEPPILSSGDFTDLTAPQQADIRAGSIVITSDSKSWIYSGSGPKDDEASYFSLGATTFDWSDISSKPTILVGTTGGHGSSDDGKAVLYQSDGSIQATSDEGGGGVFFTNTGFGVSAISLGSGTGLSGSSSGGTGVSAFSSSGLALNATVLSVQDCANLGSDAYGLVTVTYNGSLYWQGSESNDAKANTRTNLGLGDIATQSSDAVAITGGTMVGVPLNVADLPSDLERRGLHYIGQRIYAGSVPIKVALIGDSVIDSGRIPFRNAIHSNLGYAGYGLGETSGAVAGGASVITSGYTTWPTGIYFSLTSGGSVVFDLDGGTSILGDTIKVYYVVESGGGTFKIQSQSNGGSYADETGHTSISASGSTTGAIRTITKSGASSLRVKVVGLSGTVKIIGAAIYRASYSGAIVCNFARSGGDLINMKTVNSAIITPIIADVAPDLYLYEMKDDGAAITAHLATFISKFTTGYANSDWVLCGSTPYSEAADPGGTLQLASNKILRAFALANNYTYWDAFAPFISGTYATTTGLIQGDGVHPSSAGYDFKASLLMKVLGLGELTTGYRVPRDGPRLGANLHTRSPFGSNTFKISGLAGFAKILYFSDEDDTPRLYVASNDDNTAEMGLGNSGAALKLIPAYGGTTALVTTGQIRVAADNGWLSGGIRFLNVDGSNGCFMGQFQGNPNLYIQSFVNSDAVFDLGSAGIISLNASGTPSYSVTNSTDAGLTLSVTAPASGDPVAIIDTLYSSSLSVRIAGTQRMKISSETVIIDSGDFELGGYGNGIILRAPSGGLYRITVDDTGALNVIMV